MMALPDDAGDRVTSLGVSETWGTADSLSHLGGDEFTSLSNLESEDVFADWFADWCLVRGTVEVLLDVRVFDPI